MMRVCLHFPTEDPKFVTSKVCFDVPDLIDPNWRIPKGDPDPWPWLVLDEKPFELAEDIRILATIAELSPRLSPEFGKILSGSIAYALSALNKKLPGGVELGFRQEAHAAECAE